MMEQENKLVSSQPNQDALKDELDELEWRD